MPKWGPRTRLPSPFWFLRQTKLLVPAFDGATTPCRTLLFCSADRAGGVGSAEPVFQQPLAAGGCGSRGSGHAHQDLLSACTFVFTEVSLSPRSSASRSFQDISLLRGWTTDGACESRPTLYLRAARACFPWPTRVSSCVCGRRFESPGTATVQTVSGPSTAWDARSGLRKQPWAFGDSLAQSLAVPGSWTPVVGWAAIGGRPGGAAVRHAVVRHGAACPELPGLLRKPERLSLSLGRELAWRTPSFLLAAALSGLVGEAPGFSGWGAAEREGSVP